jgi:heme-degrading monooxygenase HmoA
MQAIRVETAPAYEATIATDYPDSVVQIARLAKETMEEWLREYDGYRGLIIFTDEEGQRARVVTLWESAEAEARARPSRAAMRDQVAVAAGMVVEKMELYEVPALEVLS